jgi:hypothetical protein
MHEDFVARLINQVLAEDALPKLKRLLLQFLKNMWKLSHGVAYVLAAVQDLGKAVAESEFMRVLLVLFLGLDRKGTEGGFDDPV